MSEYTYIFDIGNVLINFDLPALQKRIAESANLTYEEVQEGFNTDLFYKSETGHATSKEYFADYANKINLKWSYEDFIQAWADVYFYNETGNQLLDDLNKENDVLILSNLAELNKIAIENKFENFFTRTKRNFYSYDTGFRKPDINIYKHLLKETGLSAEKCIFFDDLQENIDAAKSIGMNGIVFDSKNIDKIKKRIG